MSLVDKFAKCIESSFNALDLRLYQKYINHTFIQKHKNKLKQYSATNCSSESAVSAVKHQLNIHPKLQFNDNSNLMLMKRNKIQQHLDDNNDNLFKQKLSKTLFDDISLNKQAKKTKKLKDELEINLFKSTAKESRQIDVRNIAKRKLNDDKLNKLKDVTFYHSEQEFLYNLQQIQDHTNRINFCKAILQKLKIQFKVRYVVRDYYGLESIQIMTTEIKRICAEKGIWGNRQTKRQRLNNDDLNTFSTNNGNKNIT